MRTSIPLNTQIDAKTVFADGCQTPVPASYHITARGNERQTIFRDHVDRNRFLAWLEESVDLHGSAAHVL